MSRQLSLVVLLAIGLSALATSAQDFVAKARHLKEKGANDEAVRVLEQGLKKDPQNATGLYVLAWLYIQKGERSKAAPLLQKVVAASPTSTEGQEAKAALERMGVPVSAGAGAKAPAGAGPSAAAGPAGPRPAAKAGPPGAVPGVKAGPAGPGPAVKAGPPGAGRGVKAGPARPGLAARASPPGAATAQKPSAPGEKPSGTKPGTATAQKPPAAGGKPSGTKAGAATAQTPSAAGEKPSGKQPSMARGKPGTAVAASAGREGKRGGLPFLPVAAGVVVVAVVVVVTLIRRRAREQEAWAQAAREREQIARAREQEARAQAARERQQIARATEQEARERDQIARATEQDREARLARAQARIHGEAESSAPRGGGGAMTDSPGPPTDSPGPPRPRPLRAETIAGLRDDLHRLETEHREGLAEIEARTGYSLPRDPARMDQWLGQYSGRLTASEVSGIRARLARILALQDVIRGVQTERRD